jgi:carboxymethylenebutenolidase
VLVWPDIFGLRPAFKTMGKRLAESGYAVLTVNPFYRQQKAPTAPAGANMSDPEVRNKLFAMMNALTPETHVTDAKAFFSWIDQQASVDARKKAGTTGYCMGGPITMRTAASLPDRIGAGASFHGGGLVTDKPDSPHLLVPKMKAQYLFAIAQNDDQQQPDAKTVLKDTFAKANLKAEIEVYPAQHGWCPPDGRVYDHDQAEKAWGRMLALFKTALV